MAVLANDSGIGLTLRTRDLGFHPVLGMRGAGARVSVSVLVAALAVKPVPSAVLHVHRRTLGAAAAASFRSTASRNRTIGITFLPDSQLPGVAPFVLGRGFVEDALEHDAFLLLELGKLALGLLDVFVGLPIASEGHGKAGGIVAVATV